MCSLNWRDFGTHIGIAFNRDERITRAKADVPKLFVDHNQQFLMPKDPEGEGSWLSANESGFVFMLLNDYQGRLKSESIELISRGRIVRELASSSTLEQVHHYLDSLPLERFQPFVLIMISQLHKQLWRYDGVELTLTTRDAPLQWYSSGHPKSDQVIATRHSLLKQTEINSDNDLIQLHSTHEKTNQPIGDSVEPLDLSFEICMHHQLAHSQSLTYIKLFSDSIEMQYWDGQPCQTDPIDIGKLVVTNTF